MYGKKKDGTRSGFLLGWGLEQVRLIEEFDDDESNTIELGEFLRMFREYDFAAPVDEELGEGIYEVARGRAFRIYDLKHKDLP